MVGLGRNEIVGVRITNISISWLEMVGAAVVASCTGGSREVQRQGRGWKRLWQRGQQRQGRRQRRVAAAIGDRWQRCGLAAMAMLLAEDEIGEGQRLWPAMATAAGKRLGSAGSDSWQRRWWRCRGRKARLRARDVGDAAAATIRRRRQGRKGRKRDARGGCGRGAGALRQQAGEGYRRPAGGSSGKGSALPKAGRRQMRRGGTEVAGGSPPLGRMMMRPRERAAIVAGDGGWKITAESKGRKRAV
ncbi:hypothetical protein BHE74_00058710 [Ensete ventricosum]|nr:hypothetical protein BHE74_00058710 [Ensete ventricosum]